MRMPETRGQITGEFEIVPQAEGPRLEANLATFEARVKSAKPDTLPAMAERFVNILLEDAAKSGDISPEALLWLQHPPTEDQAIATNLRAEVARMVKTKFEDVGRGVLTFGRATEFAITLAAGRINKAWDMKQKRDQLKAGGLRRAA